MTHQDVYTHLDSLINLQQHSSDISISGGRDLSHQFVGSHFSPLRGRGLDFDELKSYFPGDDIRHIDWRATQRTGRPHVRSFTQEKERIVHLLLDQSVSMFFGSANIMKSVAAAEIAALLGWQCIGRGDRICVTLFNDSEHHVGVAQRSRSQWISNLSLIAQYNNSLNAGIFGNDQQLNISLSRLLKSKPHQQIIYLISDFNGFDEVSEALVKGLASKNEIRMIFVYDPLEASLPSNALLPISDGKQQVLLNTRVLKIRERFSKSFTDKQDSLRILCQQSRMGSIGLYPFSAAKNPTEELSEIGGLNR